MEIIERVNELIANYLSKNGIEVVEMTYRREQGGMTLRLLADTPQGISIAECEALNNYLSEVLDKENVIEERYLIEVSSPGLDRPIKTDRDFERVMGKYLDITTYEPIDPSTNAQGRSRASGARRGIDGKRAHEGTLVGMNKDEIVIESDGVSTVIPRAKIARAKRKVEF